MKVSIIGSGTMGAGIAQVAAQAGNQVVVIDTKQEFIDKAMKNLDATLAKLVEKDKMSADESKELAARLTWSIDRTLVQNSDLIIEAIIEDANVKKELFFDLETIVDEQCILATNTSSLSITSIAAACKHPERVVGIHFFNPAPLMELVEIIPALQSHQSVVDKVRSIIDSWKKKTVLVKDTPGFIVNRIARPFYSEAIRIYEEGIANMETIDYAMKQYGHFKMGPFELMDLIGHDVNYVVTETVWKSFYYDTRYTPSFTQKRLVEAKWFGKKSGRGFYDYQEGAVRKEAIKDETLGKEIATRVVLLLINEATNALYLNVASEEDIELAMTKGVNYPKGLLAWAQEIGYSECVEGLDALYHLYHEDRYRCSVWLRKMARKES